MHRLLSTETPCHQILWWIGGANRWSLVGKRELSGRQLSKTLQHFEQASRPHATADAHGHDDILCTAPFALDQGVTDHAGA